MAAVVRLSIDKDIVNGLNSDNRILHCQIDDEVNSRRPFNEILSGLLERYYSFTNPSL